MDVQELLAGLTANQQALTDTVASLVDLQKERMAGPVSMPRLKQINMAGTAGLPGTAKTVKAVGGVQTAPALHGPGGIFQGPGLERDVITAHVRPKGIGSILPLIPSFSTDPRFASLTGYTAVSGAEPSNACDDAPSGFVKGCNLRAQFGLLRRDSNEIEMDKVMLKVNRGDFTDLILRGQVLGMVEGMTPSDLNQNDILNVVTMSELVGVGVQSERALSTRYWQGTVAAGQMPGLDSQIATGQLDADTGTTCPALDSDVKEFSYNDVCGTTLDIVEYMSAMAWYLQDVAEGTGLDPVQWVVVMRPNLWYELSACWPCKYHTNRCLSANVGANVAVINDEFNTNERDSFRASMSLPINGIDYPVITDTGIFEHNNANNANLAAGQFSSSIYFVPLTIAGGFPATYREYVDYRGAQPDRALLQGKEDWWWSDNGVFSWAVEQQKWCYKFSLKSEQRVVLRAPHLAGKIQHVMYSPLQHLREPYPESPYFLDGGVSIRGTTPGSAVWA